jgi:hypothetical protein
MPTDDEGEDEWSSPFRIRRSDKADKVVGHVIEIIRYRRLAGLSEGGVGVGEEVGVFQKFGTFLLWF